MIGCYATGMFPRPERLIAVTRAYDRKAATEKQLEEAFEIAAKEVLAAQSSVGFSHVTDGMLKWQDLLRPFAEHLSGVRPGGLARWFNNNTFYRKPLVTGDLKRGKPIVGVDSHIMPLPRTIAWKTILPAPYTFAQLSENQFCKDKTELMFKYAEALREEIEDLHRQGFEYVQLSDPALVYRPDGLSVSKDELAFVSEALKLAVAGLPVATCLQTFFGDFAAILPEALDFPVDHLGIDIYETDLERLKEYRFDKGVALGLVDSRNSLVEDSHKPAALATEILDAISGKSLNVYVCPNCDLEFLPWNWAKEKMQVVASVAELLRRQSNG